MTIKYSRELSTPQPKIPFGHCRLNSDEIQFLQEQNMTFSDWTHHHFLKDMHIEKEKKITGIVQSSITTIVGLGLMSIATLDQLPYSARLILGTSGLFCVGAGCLLVWARVKASYKKP